MRVMSGRLVLRSLVEAGVLPGAAELIRPGVARWHAGDLGYVAWIDGPHIKTNTLGCAVNISDTRFSPRMNPFGTVGFIVRSTPECEIPWPSGRKLKEDQIGVLGRQFAEAGEFVRDRRELCVLLMFHGDLVRGSLHAWLHDASLPARLVKALILARDLGDEELEARVAERVREERADWSSPSGNEMVKVMQDWAKDYSKALGIPVPLPQF